MNRFALWMVVLCFGLVLGGCAKKNRLSNAQRRRVAELVSSQPTKPEHPLDIKFGDNLTLIGYDVSSKQVELGRGVNVTWHFRVDKALGDGWHQFTHLADGQNVSRINLDGNGLIREVFPPSNWEAGTTVRDPQTILLPADWNSDKVIVYLGFWKDDERLPVKGPGDGENRARVLELPVGGDATEIPELHALQLAGPDTDVDAIALDGRLDDAAWAKTPSTAAFVNTMTGDAAEPRVIAKALWSERRLYVAFDVADDFLKSTFTNNDDHLWEQDAVEIMVDPDGDEKNYFELQVSPANKVFDTRYDSRRVPQPFGHVDWNSGLTSAVELRGTLNDDSRDRGYTVEIAIPWEAFAMGDPKHEKPKAGESWRINFYVMDAREQGQRAVGWSAPLVGDFHMPRRFGKVIFDAAEPSPVTTGEGRGPALQEGAGKEAPLKPAPKAKAKAVKPEPKAEPKADKATKPAAATP